MRLPVVFALVAGFAVSVGSAHAFTQDSVTNRAPDGGARFQDSDAPQKWGGGIVVNGKNAAQAADESDASPHTYAGVEQRAFNKTGYFEPIILLPAPKP